MGYRSEVTLTIFENDYQELIRLAKQENKLDYLKGCQLFRAKNGKYSIITMYWSWIKWCNDYEEISFIESFMRSGIHYNFRRVGEESGDIEEEYNDDDWSLSEATMVVTEIFLDNVGGELNLNNYLDSVSIYSDDNIKDDNIKEVNANEFLAIIDS